MRGDSVRVRAAVRDGGAHVGYLTTTDYPDRDITAFAEGLPHFEAVVSDLADAHVGLLQRFKRHWLIHCGPEYDTTDRGGPLTAAQLADLASLALRHRAESHAARVAILKARLESLFGFEDSCGSSELSHR